MEIIQRYLHAIEFWLPKAKKQTSLPKFQKISIRKWKSAKSN